MSKLFHFTSLKIGIEKILPDFSLKANNFYKTNDPRETFLWSFSGVNVKNKEFNDNHFESLFRVGYEARKYAKVLCFTKEETGATNEMMWSHYGSNHEGFCFEIDEEEFKKENPNIFNKTMVYLEDIDYSPDNFTNKPSFYVSQGKDWQNALNSFIEHNYKYLFFKKSHFWVKEDERRLVVIEKYWDGLLNIRNSLKSIVIGIYCYEKHIATIDELLKDTNIRVKQCEFQIDVPRINVIKRERGDYREHILKKYLKKFNY
ncbi:hypothetical protein ES708_29924 [subsurface metagenome]